MPHSSLPSRGLSFAALLSCAAAVAAQGNVPPQNPNAPVPAHSPDQPAAQQPEKPPLHWTDVTRYGLPLRLYGFLRMDVHYNTARMDSAVAPTRVLPEAGEGVAPTLGEAKENDDQLHLDPRLTRFGVELMPVKTGETTVTGRLEIDFANYVAASSSAQVAESRSTPRMRLAFLDIARGTTSLRVGQDWDVISPLFPAVNGQLLMWNAGNLGDRRAQIQGRWAPGRFEWKSSLGLTGAISNEDSDAAVIGTASTERDGFDSGLPIFQTRFGWKPCEPVEKKPLDVGAWGMYARTETDVFRGTQAENRFDTWCGGVDFTVPVCPALTLRGELWAGSGLGDVRGGIGQTINTVAGETIDSAGGWAEAVWTLWDDKKAPTLTRAAVHVGATLDDPDNSDLPTVSPTAARDGVKSRNEACYVGTVWDWACGVRTGLDATYWETLYAGPAGADDFHGTAVRAEMYFQFNF